MRIFFCLDLLTGNLLDLCFVLRNPKFHNDVPWCGSLSFNAVPSICRYWELACGNGGEAVDLSVHCAHITPSFKGLCGSDPRDHLFYMVQR